MTKIHRIPVDDHSLIAVGAGVEEVNIKDAQFQAGDIIEMFSERHWASEYRLSIYVREEDILRVKITYVFRSDEMSIPPGSCVIGLEPVGWQVDKPVWKTSKWPLPVFGADQTPTVGPDVGPETSEQG